MVLVTTLEAIAYGLMMTSLLALFLLMMAWAVLLASIHGCYNFLLRKK